MTPHRLIFIGDIHGCFDELSMLLEKVSMRGGDLVVSVGDIVRKGPRPIECLELWRDRGYVAVRGNNEEKLLNRSHSLWRRFFDSDRVLLRRRDLLEYVASFPLMLDFKEASVAVVHGGVFPDMKPTSDEVKARRAEVLTLRHIRKSYGTWVAVPKGKQTASDPFWAEVWNGPRTIVYGHSPTRKEQPRRHRFAIGLDTGCVYGGRLTAAIWDGNWHFESVAARRAYA